jgi:hypothetical protein
MRLIVSALSCAAIVATASAQQLTPEQKHNLTPERKLEQCVRAVGHEAFCECILREVPARIFFLEYVALATSSNDEIDYARMSVVQQQGVDAVRAARSKCVATVFKR